MISNRDIARQFSLFAELLLVHGEDERLSYLLSGASYRIRNASVEVASLTKKELKNFLRPELVKLVDEMNKTGTIAVLDELIQLTPPGLFEMMRIKGLGGKKLYALWHLAKIDDVETLLEACKNNRLTIPGFGARTQQNIVAAIEALNESKNRYHYASVASTAEELVDYVKKVAKTPLVSLCGDIRRKTLTVEGIEILTAIPSSRFVSLPLQKALLIKTVSKEITRGYTLDEIPVTIYHTTKTGFYENLFRRTGTQAHVDKVMDKLSRNKKFSSEDSIYQVAGFPFIEPELREDLAEWDFVKKGKELVSFEDIKGVVHNHTDWSDGVDDLQSFITACRDKGYEYCVISDHSKNAHYAGGLKEKDVLKQFAAIDTFNKKMKPFKIFKSIECDILVSGELDYSSDLLKQFDLVIISVHQQLKMDEQKATKRLVKAIENPYTTILGHMTGRQLLIRPGYPVNFKKVIDACAANEVIIEINANPYRLDMDWTHIPYAMDKGVMISVNPDAHSIGEIDNIRWGIEAARKGGLTRDMTWNAMPLAKIQRWLSRHKK